VLDQDQSAQPQRLKIPNDQAATSTGINVDALAAGVARRCWWRRGATWAPVPESVKDA
jgi:hypothetical protein